MTEPYRYPINMALELLTYLLETGIRSASILSEPAALEVRRGDRLRREALSRYSMILRVEDPVVKERIGRRFPDIGEAGLDAWADYFNIEVRELLELIQCINSRRSCGVGGVSVEFVGPVPCEEVAVRSGELAPFLPKKSLVRYQEWPGGAPEYLIACREGGRERPLLEVRSGETPVNILIDRYLLDELGVHPYVLAAFILEERG